MKVKDIAKKYSIDKDSFVDFLVEHKLPVTTHLLSGASVDDAKADFYARLYKGCKAAARGEYPFTENQQEELSIRIGEIISEGMSEEKLAEFDAIDDSNEAAKWLRINKPNYARDVAAQTYKIVYEIESKK